MCAVERALLSPTLQQQQQISFLSPNPHVSPLIKENRRKESQPALKSKLKTANKICKDWDKCGFEFELLVKKKKKQHFYVVFYMFGGSCFSGWAALPSVCDSVHQISSSASHVHWYEPVVYSATENNPAWAHKSSLILNGYCSREQDRKTPGIPPSSLFMRTHWQSFCCQLLCLLWMRQAVFTSCNDCDLKWGFMALHWMTNQPHHHTRTLTLNSVGPWMFDDTVLCPEMVTL